MNIFTHPDLIQDATRGYLAIFYTIVALFYTVRIITLKRITGREHVYHGKLGSANWWHHKTFNVFRVTIWAVCVARWMYPGIDEYLGIFSSMSVSWLILLGDVLLAVGFTWTVLVHLTLGHHWTSGINGKGPNVLITKGIYRFTRNPIFLGVLVSQFGFWLALPSWFSLICLVFGVTIIMRQTYEEEHHLALRFPNEYFRYRSEVRRWL